MPTIKKIALGKKSAVKKGVKKPKRVLAQAYGEQCFWTKDGSIISNLVELRDLMARMANDVFTYHVTKEKNDFADWVQHVLGDGELANALRGAKKPKSAQTVIVRRLKIYDL